MNQEANIDGIKKRLKKEYAKYDEIMKSMPDFMKGPERNQRIAVAHAQRGRIEGLELAMHIIISEAA